MKSGKWSEAGCENPKKRLRRMKRYGNLWEQLTCFSNLLHAAQQAARGKRDRPNVARFLFDLESQLFQLEDELRQRSYRPGAYQTFHLTIPKPRMISAAPFRDRVVHHALCRVLEPLFEPAFIFDSYACRVGKGTHAAVNRFNAFARANSCVLKCDVQKYFPSIDHEILKELLARKVKDKDVLWLIGVIVAGSNPQEPQQEWYPGDDLFAPGERRRGLPIGNQTSQFFANVYLNPFDHWVKETLGARCYLRYVDDFCLFSNDKGWLGAAREACRAQLTQLRLRLHPRKAVVSRVQDGTRFLGYRIFPDHRLLPRDNVKRMRQRMKMLQQAHEQRQLSDGAVLARMAAWVGHARHADTFRLRRRLFRGITIRWRDP